MKILFLTNHLKGDDGWSRYSFDFIKEIQNTGYQVLVLTFKKSEQKLINELPILKHPLKYLTNPLNVILTSFKIRRIMKKFSPDIVHFMVEPYINLLLLFKNIRARTFLTCHGTYAVIPNLTDKFLMKKVFQILSRNYFQKLTGIIAVSNYTKDYLLKYYPQIKPKVRVITNGIDLEEYRPLDLNKKPKNRMKQILFVGSIKRRKGILETVEALKCYYDNFSKDFIYNVVGDYNPDDDYYQEVLRKIKEYGLDEKVVFQGKITAEKLRECYQNADLFIMLSININNQFEGFGLVFLEANASGVPCIGSKNCGAEEAILDGRTGYLVNPYNPKEIAEKINLILNQNSINREDCLNWVKQNDIKIKAGELVDFYQAYKNF